MTFFGRKFPRHRMVLIVLEFFTIIFFQEISSLQNGTVGLSGGQAVVFLMKIL